MSTQNVMLDKITKKQQMLSQDWLKYWNEFSSFNTWQFWFNVLIFIVPLIVLYFKINRKKAFQIGFYGFSVHVWMNYIDSFGTTQGYWEYPYKMLIFIHNSFGLDASLTPVLFMFVYQWTMNNNKKYYVYALLLSVLLSFVFKPILSAMNMFKLYHGANYIYIFLGYIIIFIFSKLITDLFLYFQTQNTSE